jgi:hypothetical protein
MKGGTMNNKEELRLLAHARELEAAGIPMDHGPVVESDGDVSIPELLIRQEEPGAADVVIPLPSRLVAYMWHVTITNICRHAVWIFGFHLEPPWGDFSIQLLRDLAEYHRRENLYRFPGGLGFEFPREEVMNHLIREKGRLSPGDSLCGWVLGFGTAPVPMRFRGGEIVPMKFTVETSTERCSTAYVHLMVDRTLEAGREGGHQGVSPRRRKPLFETPAAAESETPSDCMEDPAKVEVRGWNAKTE